MKDSSKDLEGQVSEEKSQKIVSVPIGPAGKGETAIYRKPSHAEDLFKIP